MQEKGEAGGHEDREMLAIDTGSSKEDQDPYAPGVTLLGLFYPQISLQASSIHLPPKACTGAMAAHMPDSTAHQAERATQGKTAWRCQAQPWVLNTHTP